ncbi:MAG: Na(+)-translocating NADH-quinone reductase subunit C, partial [Planctomycetota bacterium]
MPPKDSIANTFLVSFILCVVCSLVVSSAAVFLKPLQKKNKELDQQRNILAAAGLTATRGDEEIIAKNMKAAEIESLFESRITKMLLDIESGDYVEVTEANASFDPRKAAKKDDENTDVTGSFD